MTQHEFLETKTLAEVGEDIGLAEGIKLVNAFAAANPEATKGYYIGRNVIDQILSQPGCVGINFRKCLTELNQEHLVYTGVDADGKTQPLRPANGSVEGFDAYFGFRGR